MKETRNEVFALLDAVRAADDTRVRRQAIARLASTRSRAEDRLLSVSTGTRGAARDCRSRAGAIRSRFEALGIPNRSIEAVDPRIARSARRLVLADRDALDALVVRLGRAELSLLCRDLDDGSARRLLGRLGSERASLERDAKYIPPPDDGLLRIACRRLASAGASSRVDRGLVRYAGEGLAAHLLAFAEPDVAAALERRLEVLARCDAGIETSALGWAECFGRFAEEVGRA